MQIKMFRVPQAGSSLEDNLLWVKLKSLKTGFSSPVQPDQVSGSRPD